MSRRAGAQDRRGRVDVMIRQLPGNPDQDRDQGLHLLAIRVPRDADVADPDLQAVTSHTSCFQAFMRNGDVPSHASQRFSERGAGGLNIIEKSQLTRLDGLGEMKAEERIIHGLRSELEKCDLVLNSDPRSGILEVLEP